MTTEFVRWLMDHDPTKNAGPIEIRCVANRVEFVCDDDIYSLVDWDYQRMLEALFAAAHSYATRPR